MTRAKRLAAVGEAAARAERDKAEASLRPTRLDEITGQDGAVGVLRQMVAAAKGRGELPAHVLLVGPPGTGKTTIAGAIANETGAALTVLYGINLRTRKDIVPVLKDAVDWKRAMAEANAAAGRKVRVGNGSGSGRRMAGGKGGMVLMIDEIHRMWAPVQELVYPVLEDGLLDIGGGQRLPLLPLMVIGATTDPARLMGPLLDRFLVVRLEPYAVGALGVIAQRAGKALGVTVDDAAATAIAEAAAGTPRVAIKLVRSARDYAVGGKVTAGIMRKLLENDALIWRVPGRDAGGLGAAARA